MLVLILLLMPTLNFLPVWFALSLLSFRLPSRLPMMFILWMVAMMLVVFFFQAEDGIRDVAVTGVQTCALPISHRRTVSRCGSPVCGERGLARAGQTGEPQRETVRLCDARIRYQLGLSHFAPTIDRKSVV